MESQISGLHSACATPTTSVKITRLLSGGILVERERSRNVFVKTM